MNSNKFRRSVFLARLLKGVWTIFFRQFTPDNFHALLAQELGDARRLDKFAATRAEENSNRAAMAVGPEFLVHITAGNIPNPALMSIALGLLARSAQFVKCASGGVFLPRLFAHSIYDADPKLGACLEIAAWRGGNADLENALVRRSRLRDSDRQRRDAGCNPQRGCRSRLASSATAIALVRFCCARRFCPALRAKKIIAAAADDVVAWNQLGCLSPHVIYVEAGGDVSPENFAEMLADELERREQTEPRGELPAEHAAAIASRRGIYEVRAAHSPETTRHWCSKDSTAWTVVFEADTRFQVSCLNRFIYVKAVTDLTAALHGADEIRGKVSTVGIAAPEEKMQELAAQLARWGATRVCPLGQMQNPPLTWRHDGRPALGDLVTWTDLEF